ncbi:hypothetical protein COLU111180_12980 [Cohnella lubricantis]|uniref:Endolytic transglycosylase MltG n=1 Tax=Cohnella lubricantis TaxID=2163172 RepID=A0A841TGX8_9BACL|nr:hypothetical protein [Cohnella lubricantis]MBB6679385.1 hypothetical protein [Cohnella lubricantis]MBP2117467.1 hypothetical protein [Cohnella lubricantis]
MRKRRSWLIGFGLGLAIGAILLQLMTAAESAGKSALPNEPLSKEDLQKEAAAQGLTLVDPEADGRTYTQEELDAAVAKAKEAAASGQTAAGSEAERANARTLYVWQDATLAEVSDALMSLGLINDKQAFIQQAKPYSTKIRVGPCTFEGKPSYDEIIEELTRNKY